ncbi:MAG: hypothetical protein QOJ46_1287 [bacterium]
MVPAPTTMFSDFESVRPELSVTRSVTANVPALEKAWLTAAPDPDPPPPKVHCHATMLPAGAPGRSSLDGRPLKLTATPTATLPVGLEQWTGHGSHLRPGAEQVQRAIGSPAAVAAAGIAAAAASAHRMAQAATADLVLRTSSTMSSAADRAAA